MDHGASSPIRAAPDMTWIHFLHVVSVIVWFGGVITLNVLAVRVGMGADRAAQAALLRLSDLYGRAVIAPAGIVTLVTGFVLRSLGGVGDVEGEERSEEPEEQPHRNPLVVAAVVLLVIAVAGVAWWSRREQVVSVPDLVGRHVNAKSFEPVRTSLRSQQLLIGEVSRTECAGLPSPETVVSQTPAPGAQVPIGTRVDLVICEAQA
jgi:PASTA domain